MLRINLFGCAEVIQPRLGVVTPLGQKAGELLALLLLRGHHRQHREKLANLLWPQSSPDNAAHSFRTTLWRLRQALEPPGVSRGTYLCKARSGEIAFNWDSDHSVDVLEFLATLSRCDAPPAPGAADVDMRSIEGALRLYEGELLEGHCDDWIVHERERLREIFIRGLCYMLRELSRRQEFQRAIRCGQRVLSEDPLHESVHRDLMNLYARVGQRAAAIKLYERLNETLQRELEVAPAAETTRVYVQILQLESRTQPGTEPARGVEMADAINQLQSSLDALAQEHRRLSHALETIKSVLAKAGDSRE